MVYPLSSHANRADNPDRRAFLKVTALAGAGALVSWDALASASFDTQTPAPPAAPDLWADAATILRRIVAPTFPDRTFDVTRYGAIAGGSDATAAFRAAIAACHAAGGGRVTVPDGRFLTGPIVLQSNVNLHLADGAVLAFSRDPRAYLPVVFTRWEGTEG